ncbi:hypothetical protein QBC36DRAFT_372733 [Triangularia setosa]|uniref:Plastocyanin-like domain-containing protein n=1 Tax=Triangularia setosa TaxID=2587417 RepID=A0AAN7A8A6_9PEZI|nr:hypothetical protein QBC36DRAFT_372733 [Podospora setosa]
MSRDDTQNPFRPSEKTAPTSRIIFDSGKDRNLDRFDAGSHVSAEEDRQDSDDDTQLQTISKEQRPNITNEKLPSSDPYICGPSPHRYTTPMITSPPLKNTAIHLHLINPSSFTSFYLTIDSHPELTIIEIDGIEVTPIAVPGVYVNIGQRYSILVTPVRSTGSFAISILESVNYQGTALLSYPSPYSNSSSDNIPPNPNTNIPPFKTISSKLIRIRQTSYSPLRANAQLWLSFSQDFTGDDADGYNNYAFPLTSKTYCYQRRTRRYNLDGPMRRDALIIPGLSHVVIRFLADKPGIWALHCHVAWHMEAGMLVTFLKRPDNLKHLIHDMELSTRELSRSFCADEVADTDITENPGLTRSST